MTPFGFLVLLGFIRYFKGQDDGIVLNERSVYHYSIYQLINTIDMTYFIIKLKFRMKKNSVNENGSQLFLLLQHEGDLDCMFFKTFIKFVKIYM